MRYWLKLTENKLDSLLGITCAESGGNGERTSDWRSLWEIHITLIITNAAQVDNQLRHRTLIMCDFLFRHHFYGCQFIFIMHRWCGVRASIHARCLNGAASWIKCRMSMDAPKGLYMMAFNSNAEWKRNPNTNRYKIDVMKIPLEKKTVLIKLTPSCVSICQLDKHRRALLPLNDDGLLLSVSIYLERVCCNQFSLSFVNTHTPRHHNLALNYG